MDEKDQTPLKKEQVTKDLSYSVVAKALADILVDCITPASIHVILGLTKKIVEWILALWAKLKALEKEKTKGHTTYQFRQSVVEARDISVEYGEFLTQEFQGMVDTIEGKKKEIKNIMKGIERATEKVKSTPPGKRQATWIAKPEKW